MGCACFIYNDPIGGEEHLGRKNRRNPMDYQNSLRFDPQKYIRSAVKYRDGSTGLTGADGSAAPKRGEVWFADLGEHTWTSVQEGCRPVVIVSNDMGNRYADTVNVVPLTRHLKRPELPCHTEISDSDLGDAKQALDASMVLTEQITTISKRQLRNYVGRIDDPAAMGRINRAIGEQLDLATASITGVIGHQEDRENQERNPRNYEEDNNFEQ